ncbi:unnamed protein product [Rhizoctonia solani]|uniref:Protein kinase domain-containing protein n=1 Tax=Rhizoctonia solani TaxID=456999 RepID=A0A8H3A7M7_9AGAM|nr:unnamed protein product [Rhizoctonia solani]
MPPSEILNYGDIIRRLCEKGGNIGSKGQAANPEIVTVPTDAKPPLHCLIIGIDKYKVDANLSGAVSDARLFKSYLVESLGVPEGQISLLIDEEAKREDIIQAFQGLAQPDNGIRRDEPILIYYAGLGGEMDAPSDQLLDSLPVNCIIPQDASQVDGIMPIPEFTLAVLVHQIALEKGNNITMIFDCCYSLGGFRNPPEGARVLARTNCPNPLIELDQDIIQAALVGSSTWCSTDFTPRDITFESIDSDFVLLEACGHGEVACENGASGYGYFSIALLKLLRSVKVDCLTYKECIRRLPAFGGTRPQTPVCKGKNIDRFLFHAKVPGASTSFIPIKSESGQTYLQAGLAQGVTPGSMFKIYSKPIVGWRSKVLGTLEVDRVEPLVAYLKHSNTLNLPALSYGQLIGYGSNNALAICVTQQFVDAALPDSMWAELFSGDQDELIVRPVEPWLAQVTLSANAKGDATFTLANQVSVQYNIQTLPTPCYEPIIPYAPKVVSILKAIARWHQYLRHLPATRPFQKKVDLEFKRLRLTGEYTTEGGLEIEPYGPNLNVGGVADIMARDDDYYGMKVINRSEVDLYVYLLQLECSNMRICEQTHRRLELSSSVAQLPKNAALTLGYGSPSQYPFFFEVFEPMNFDVTIWKVFVSTCPAQIVPVQHESPFRRGRVDIDTFNDLAFDESTQWDALTINILQRRFPKGEEPIPLEEPGVTTTELHDLQGKLGLLNLGLKPAPRLSSMMSVEAILKLLVQHGCPDMTSDLDLERCEGSPAATGGSAEVYRGCLRNSLKVAIKRSKAEVPDDEKGRGCITAMAREAYMTSKYEHPNILQTCGVAQFRNGIALIAPWMDNGTVIHYIRTQPGANRLKLCADIACGVAYLHDVETAKIHGDLKGDNILVSLDGVAKITDFGSTAMKHHTLQFTAGAHVSFFTLRWAAPELLQTNGKSTVSTDVYALGMTILEVITKALPFSHLDDERGVIGALFRGERPKRPLSDIPESSTQGNALWNLLQNCWKINPQNRPSAGDVFELMTSLTQEGLMKEELDHMEHDVEEMGHL